MKKLIFAAVLLSSSASFAQINVEEINRTVEANRQREAQIKKERRAERREKFKSSLNESLGNIGSHFAKTFTSNDKFPTRTRKVLSEEKVQVRLLSCVEKILGKYKGGLESPRIGFDILMLAMDGDSITTDQDKIQETLAYCKETSAKLQGIGNLKMDYETITKKYKALPQESVSEAKVKKTVTTLYKNENIFTDYKYVKVAAGPGVTVGAGVILVRTLDKDGTIRVYSGPEVGIGFGLGAWVKSGSQVLYDNGSSYGNGDLVEVVEDMEYFPVLGSVHDDEENTYSSRGVSVGLGMSIAQANLRLPLPGLKAPRRWEMVLDLLK